MQTEYWRKNFLEDRKEGVCVYNEEIHAYNAESYWVKPVKLKINIGADTLLNRRWMELTQGAVHRWALIVLMLNIKKSSTGRELIRKRDNLQHIIYRLLINICRELYWHANANISSVRCTLAGINVVRHVEHIWRVFNLSFLTLMVTHIWDELKWLSHKLSYYLTIRFLRNSRIQILIPRYDAITLFSSLSQ